jgi:hypothetical protein
MKHEAKTDCCNVKMSSSSILLVSNSPGLAVFDTLSNLILLLIRHYRAVLMNTSLLRETVFLYEVR